MKVHEIMTRDVKSCRPEDSLSVPAQLMWDHDCGCVPVVDSQMQLVGVITDRDIAMAAYTQGKTLSNSRVSTAMAKEVFACLDDDPVGVAEHSLRTHKVRRLPVTDSQGHLVGILSLNDLARAAVRDEGKRDKPVTLGSVARTLGAICEPRTPAATQPARAASQPSRWGESMTSRIAETVGAQP